MSNNQEINIYNMYDYVTYDYDVENNILGIYWDKDITELNKLISDDMDCFTYKYDNKKKYNCLWIDELKKCVDYREGEKMPFQIRVKYGHFFIHVKYDIARKFIMEEINEDGYLYICPYGDVLSYIQGTCNTHEIYPTLIKCDCLYNEFIDENNKPYILK